MSGRISTYIFSLLALILIIASADISAADEIDSKEAANVKNAIEGYITDDIKLKGGFLIYDSKAKKALNLKFDNVHESVKKVESGEYFACVDFVDQNNNIYDIDFYVDKKSNGTMEISNMVLHKLNGESLLK